MDRRQRTALQLLSFAALLTCAHCQCSQGWREYEHTCYYFSIDAQSWMEANAFCLKQNSNLMSIQNIYEMMWLRTQISTETYWIGLNDQISEGHWEWTDGSPLISYLINWMNGQPDDTGDEPGQDCVQVVGSSFAQWADEDCNAERKFICKHKNPNPGPHCDVANGWMPHGSNCYKLNSETWKSWSGARHDCVLHGTDLVSIQSIEEEQYVTAALGSPIFDIWIGLSTLKCNKISCHVEAGNEEFYWSDALEVDYTNWADSDHTVDSQTGTCVAIIKGPTDELGKWTTYKCGQERPYMCKQPLSTVCPPGWMSFGGSCYWLVNNMDFLTTWYEAFTECSNMGAHLLVINSQEEQYFINGILPNFHQVNVPDIWIGLSDKDKDGEFRWVDKTAMNFTNYGPGWPKDTADVWDCGQIFTGNYDGKWETTTCFKSMGYICEMTGGQNIKPTAAPDSHCDAGYLLYGDFCYWFETETMKNWQDAEAHCKSERAHLASFHSQEELSFLTAHLPAEAWVGLNDIDVENTFVNTDGTAADLLPWGSNQPDNWQNNEDCVHLKGMNDHEPGTIGDEICTSTKDFICKKAKGEGPPPQPPTSGPGWNEKCGAWTSDPYNDYCYLFNYLSQRTWAEARADCVNQGGELVSVTDPYEQAFVQGVIQQSPTGTTLWMGGHDFITGSGWQWTDGSPFRFTRWSEGNPGNNNGEDCLSMLVNGGDWKDENCESIRGYMCKRRGNTPEPPPPHDGYMTVQTCQGSVLVLHCPLESVINIHSAFFGRNSANICLHPDGSGGGTCTVDGILPDIRKVCDNRQFCVAVASVEEDPCPSVAKYLEIVYSCEQKVCLHGLGVEDGTITDSQLSASSSVNHFTPTEARLNGDSCWMPSGSLTSSWIQVNLGQVRKVTGIVIQGCPQADNWVTKFKIQHSLNGATFTDYTADGESFPGSVDRDTHEINLLGTPVSAQYIRIIPLAFSGQAGLRFDVLGCTPDYAVTCADTPSFDSTTDQMTVHCPAACARSDYIVYGTTEYRGDSNICAAAIHAGVVLNENGGDCTLLKTEGKDFYAGSTRNGITSRQYDGDYAVSYTFTDGELRCSGPDWYEFGEFCYKPFGDTKSWHDARDTCKKLGAELVSVLSLTEQSWLESYMYMANSDVWTGLNDLFLAGMYTWSDEHQVTFTHWSPGEPNNHEGFHENCVEMSHQTGRWSDVSCTKLNSFVCKVAKAHYPLPSVIPTVYGCPQGWDAYGYACYWMEETARSWSDAKGFCEEQDSFLVHIADIYEQAHFTVALSTKTGLWWIGLRAQGEEGGLGVDYVWDNGLPVAFTHWDKDQPDSRDGTCVAMTSGKAGGFWDDKPCADKYAFICEKPRPDISPPTKAPTPPPSEDCAESWTSLSHLKYCYKLFHNVDWSQRKSWGKAHEDCVDRGGNLVSIHSQVEEDFLTTYSKGSSKWIGLQHNPTEGGYFWSDGSALDHTNWGLGEPNNHDDREDCVEMVSSTNGTLSWWNDLNCDAHQDWICQIDKGKTPILPPVAPSPVPAPDCGTNPGWRKDNGICYYYNDTDMVDFHTALARCYDEHSTLVSILSKDEQAYVNSMVGTGRMAEAWIGMRMHGVADGQYIWVDHSPVTYTHWSPGEPNNANGEEQCVQMSRHQGGWNDANCGRAGAGYVCKKHPGDVHTHPPPTQPWEGYCPEGWMRFKDKCFLFKGKKDDIQANWSDARSWCKEQGGELAVIDNQYENDFVASYLRDLHLPTWIGLSDLLVENQYAWSDGVSPVLYTNWKENEPDNADGAEDCVSITHNHLVSGRWADDACHKEHSFVCSRKKSSGIDPPPPTQSPCPDGYTSWYNNCYKLVEQAATWDAAQTSCEQQGGNLASIDMSYDQAFVAGVVLHGRADAWIGLKRKEDGSYAWTDGWPVFFTQWGPGEPSNVEGEGCVSMHASLIFHGTWNDTRCDLAKPYICKISSETPPPTPAHGGGKCLPSWQPYGHHCYIVYNGVEGFSWPDSRHYCQAIKGDLASIHSRAEVEFIRNFNITRYHDIWIGLTKDSNFGWGWTDMTSLGFTNWAPGQPDSAIHPGEVAEEKCVEMLEDGTWNDNNCLQKRGFVCQHRQFHATDDGGNPIFPTDGPAPSSNAGATAGIIVAVILVLASIAGVLYYVFSVSGYKLSDLSLPTKPRSTVEVTTFSNPNFPADSDI